MRQKTIDECVLAGAGIALLLAIAISSKLREFDALRTQVNVLEHKLMSDMKALREFRERVEEVEAWIVPAQYEIVEINGIPTWYAKERVEQ